MLFVRWPEIVAKLNIFLVVDQRVLRNYKFEMASLNANVSISVNHIIGRRWLDESPLLVLHDLWNLIPLLPFGALRFTNFAYVLLLPY